MENSTTETSKIHAQVKVMIEAPIVNNVPADQVYMIVREHFPHPWFSTDFAADLQKLAPPIAKPSRGLVVAQQWFDRQQQQQQQYAANDRTESSSSSSNSHAKKMDMDMDGDRNSRAGEEDAALIQRMQKLVQTFPSAESVLTDLCKLFLA
jgi:hypothetical protein